jgi:putative CocE/NonD family hydrolase
MLVKASGRDIIRLEQRRDIVRFTSAPLEHDLDVIGLVTVTLSIRSNREHTDFYACLCDVDRKGRPMQVVDGYLRLRPGRPAAAASGVRQICIECWPTAYRFKRGHRLRLIVGSGAHPRYARNLGTGEPLSTATAMVTAQQQILHGSVHDSLLQLSVSGA